MEKDIEILEEMKKSLWEYFEDFKIDKDTSSTMKKIYEIRKAQVQALENLIKGYRDLEYENKYLKEHIAMLISLEQENIDLNNELNKLKSKIKESIEEYKQEMKEIRAKEKGLIWNHRLHKLDYGIQVLQELMEDK